MKQKANGKWWIIALAGIFLLISGLAEAADNEKREEFFLKSLHHTTEGMRYWYEEQGGFMEITKIPYQQLGCKNCHTASCSTCHGGKETKTSSAEEYSIAKARDMDTCLKCHSREEVTFKLGKKEGTLDVHIAAGMVCADCHRDEDVHGDGKFYHSMRDPGALKASCTNCHTPDTKVYAHKLHQGKLDCAACHVKNTTSCANCHFDTFLRTKKKKGSFLPPIQSWLLLINYHGKVTTGNVQTLVYQDHKFIAYVPYFTHAVQAKGKSCEECHNNAAMKLIKAGKSVPMMQYQDGKIVDWKGVAPVVPDKLDWVFLNKDGANWRPIVNDEKVKIQFAGHGKPLTPEQIDALIMPIILKPEKD